MIRGAVLPHSKGGLIGAVMLGLGRAMGETIAVALVIGSAAQITANIFAPGDSMPPVIANQWGEARATFRAALIGLAVTLFVITILVNVIANTVVQRSIKKSRGALTCPPTLERPPARPTPPADAAQPGARGGAPRAPSPACSCSRASSLVLIPLLFVLFDVLTQGPRR